MKTNKVKIIFALVIVLCMMLGTAVFAQPEPVEVPELEGSGIQAISAEDEMLYISDEELEGITPEMPEINETEEATDEDETNNTVLFIVAGVGIVVLIGIVVFMMKKQ
ncbi:MAG: hypothetical protein FWC79_02140 [Oscillospiraceae bacterium]|nr:hypothetical protein [Oscillospiraceae bacterium]